MYNLFPFWHAAVPEHPPSSVSLLRHRTLIIVILLSKITPPHHTETLCILLGYWGEWIRLLPALKHNAISYNNLHSPPWPLEFGTLTRHTNIHKLVLAGLF